VPSRLLIIDDDKSLHSLVRSELEQDDVTVQSAFDGIAGLILAKDVRPDVILLDVSMPRMDGYEVCELLHVQSETANIPILFLSANADPAERAKGLNAGAADFIAKPFLGDELRARVRVSLRHKYLLDQEAKRALRDGLTGAWNRAYFDERLRCEHAASSRHGHPLSCIMLDIDRFKSLNDSFGHPFGDLVIRKVVDMLNQICRIEDVVCRYGGEEFVILCPSVSLSGATQLAERVRRGIAEHAFESPTGIVRITCSFGVSQMLQATSDELVEAADKALYLAKHAGRNQVCSAPTPENLFAHEAVCELPQRV
jgi:two-component system cell cycle response regulator